MKNTSIICSLLLLLSACHYTRPVAFTVQGTFTGAPGKRIMLAELPFNSPQRLVLDSATLDSAGNFKLTTIQQQEGMYQLFIEDGAGILLINDTTDIVVHANTDSLGKYSVKNSEGSRSIKSLYERLMLLQDNAKRANGIADSIAKVKMPDSLKIPYRQLAERSNKAVPEFLNAYLSLEKNATALWFGLGVASRFLTKEEWSKALEKASAAHANHAGIMLMKSSLMAVQQQETMGKELLNKPIANITLPDSSGKPVSVGSFKGKWLLLDFWASWCAPCRADNPNLVAAFKQYHNKNFTILGVSLDKNKMAWTKAIRQDSLHWTQVSDLKEWESKAVSLYGFNAIPFNILVDTAGTAIAVNLHGPALQQKLSELLSKKVTK